MEIDHIGVVVIDINESISFWKDAFGYAQLTDIVVNTRQRLKVVFMEKNNSVTIKLIQPIDNESPVAPFAKRGGGLHHLCFKSNDMNDSIVQLNQKGLRTITNPEPGEAFNNHDIAVLHSQQNLLIELIDTSEKAALLE